MSRRAAALVLFLAPLALAHAQNARKQSAQATFLGAQSCSSSSCHGGAGEKRSQYLTWLRQDFHTRTFAILTNARSERIADAVGIEDPANHARCTSCHAPFQAVAQNRLGPQAEPKAGVSCESCHGAAGVWLRGHTRPDWTYAHRVGAGMRDLKNLYVRANTCVACHQNIDADLSAAGHPGLVFELDRQTVQQPMHWRDPPGTGPRAWLIGQAVALREASWKLASNPATNEQTLQQWRGLAWLLQQVAAVDASLGLTRLSLDSPDFSQTQREADALARRVARKQNLDPAFLRRLRIALAGTAGEFRTQMPREILFARAQRLVLALAALEEENDDGPRVTAELRHATRSLAEFDPADFARHLQALQTR